MYASLLNCSAKAIGRVVELSPYSTHGNVPLCKMMENNGRGHGMFRLNALQGAFCGQTWI